MALKRDTGDIRLPMAYSTTPVSHVYSSPQGVLDPHTVANAKRKPHRAFVACNFCRTSKVKCDEGTPQCKRCIDKGIMCQYLNSRLEKLEKKTLISESLVRIKGYMERGSQVLEAWESKNTISEHISKAKNSAKTTTSSGPKGCDLSPMWQEERRGCLSLFGKGEGDDYSSTAKNGSSSYFGKVQPKMMDQSQDTAGPIMPDFDRQTVFKFVKSFEDNINRLHPLLSSSQLEALTENFLDSIPSKAMTIKKDKSLSRDTAEGGSVHVVRHLESVGGEEISLAADDLALTRGSHYQSSPSFKTISSALVLIVLALGEVCLHRGKLPDVCHNQSPQISAKVTDFSRNPTVAQAKQEAQHHPKHSSLENYSENLRGPERNLDAVPGLKYFAIATEIIGNQLGAISLEHAHVNILAGIYHAQLIRPIESYAYIYKACNTVQFLLRPNLERFKRIAHSGDITLMSKRDNPLIYTFWTCLQLESDILTELPCPPSGILDYQEDVPTPNLVTASEKGFDHRVLHKYQAQILMRQHLNMLCGMFGGRHAKSTFPLNFSGNSPTCINQQQPPPNSPIFAALEWNLATLKDWSDENHPSTDILDACLRATYYSAQIITYRSFLLTASEYSSALKMSNIAWISVFKV